VRVEVGGRHSTETLAPASASTAATPGVTPNEVNSVRAKLTVPVPFVKQASIYGEAENDVIETDKRMLAAGGEMQIGSKSRLYARHEFINAIGGPFELNNFQSQNTTVFGLDTEYMREGSVFSEYRGRNAFAGREAEAAMGLRNGWHLADGLRLNTTFERINPITGVPQNEAIAGATALEYTRNPNWKGTARLELRTSESSDSLLNTLGFARKLSTDWTFLGKTIYYGVDQHGPSAGTKTQARFQTGLAYRQTRTDRWHALLKYEFKYENDKTQTDFDLDRKAHILSLHASLQPTRDWTLSGHYASKLVFEGTGNATDTYDAHLLALRVTYDLTKRWDVGLNSSMLFDTGFRSMQFGLGPEVGWTFLNNMRVAAGFNFFGFKDEDLAAQDYTNPGFFISFRLKFDETLLGRGNNSRERSGP
jgi:large repetitive protein